MVVFITHVFRTPRNDRQWSLDQALLPTATIENTTITLHNIRNFTYVSEAEFIPSYYDKKIDITDLVSVDFILEPLAPIGIAHTLL